MGGGLRSDRAQNVLNEAGLLRGVPFQALPCQDTGRGNVHSRDQVEPAEVGSRVFVRKRRHRHIQSFADRLGDVAEQACLCEQSSVLRGSPGHRSILVREAARGTILADQGKPHRLPRALLHAARAVEVVESG